MLETITKPIEFDNVTIFITEFLSKRNLEAPIVLRYLPIILASGITRG
ncbi:hypothetical protein [Pseudoalteromonas sp. 2CM28B]|nr:hypothetical protein [Pseudoalteromonas sp. 2CM28B]MCK8132217.1 hypothetical protein [Pseudoalteromonas sp. 2CM28B]